MVKSKKIQKIISELTNKIVEGYKPFKIILFGSYAYGTPNKESDIDMLIIKEMKERPIDRWISVCKLVSNQALRVPFESIVVTKKELEERIKRGDQFVNEILTKGVVLYEQQ